MAQGDLHIELLSGQSDRRSLSLRSGEPVEPISLGFNASWCIQADGVSDVHAFLYFDGEALFIASGDPNNPPVAAGSLVGPEWLELLPPCELRLGHAILAVRPAGAYAGAMERSAEMDFDDKDCSTARVDARELQAEHRRRKPKVDFHLQDDEPTRMAKQATPPVAHRRSRRKPKIKVPTAEESTRYRPIDEMVPARRRDEPARQQPVAPDAAPEAGYPPQVASGFMPPGVGGAPAWNPMPGAQAPAPQGAPVAPIGSFAVGVPQPPAAPALPPSAITTASTSSKSSPLNKIVEMWKAASLPQKAILCLLPVAFGAVLVMFGDEEPAPTRKKPASQASAVVSASAAPSAPLAVATASATAPPPLAPETAQPKQASTPADKDKGPQPTSGKGAPPRTLERQAVDAVIAGSHTEAIKLYEQLGAEHPEAPAYKEAARILRSKAEGR